jgi:hypothetical protein
VVIDTSSDLSATTHGVASFYDRTKGGILERHEHIRHGGDIRYENLEDSSGLAC